jgi:Flp pilus assembly pilin Flp
MDRESESEDAMNAARNSLRTFLKEDSGQGMVEYILIIGLIVLFIIVALVLFKDSVVSFIGRVKGWIDGSNPP